MVSTNSFTSSTVIYDSYLHVGEKTKYLTERSKLNQAGSVRWLNRSPSPVNQPKLAPKWKPAPV